MEKDILKGFGAGKLELALKGAFVLKAFPCPAVILVD